MRWTLQQDAVSRSDREALAEFILSDARLTQGDRVAKFEVDFAKWQGCKYAVFVNSGSSANLLMLAVMKELHGWDSSTRIVVPALAWATTVAPILQLGMCPVFVDVDLDVMSLGKLASNQIAHFNEEFSVSAILPINTLGIPARYHQLNNLCNQYDVQLMEDNCEGQGCCHGPDEKLGNMGVVSTFSFYWAHHMTTIEGGMLCTNREDIYHLALMKRSHGLVRELPVCARGKFYLNGSDISRGFLFGTDGFNIRGNELTAFLGNRQLQSIDQYNEIRDNNATEFDKICGMYPQHLHKIDFMGNPIFALPLVFRDKTMKVRVEYALRYNHIEFRPIISGNILAHPMFDKVKKYEVWGQLKNTNIIHTNGLYIGNNQFVGSSEMELLRSILKEVFDGE